MMRARALCLGYGWLAILLIAEVLVLAVVQSPAERFTRYLVFDSGADLAMQHLMARGFRPTVDFGCIYGLLPLLINRAWYGAMGLSPAAYRAEVVLITCLTAWGMARLAAARRVGPAGAALMILAMPDVLFPSYSTVVHVLEPALLVHGLAEQARGRRANALALATASCFVKPAMGYVYGLVLLVGIVAASRGQGRSYWLRSLGPAAAVGGVLALVLSGFYGPGAVVEQLIPTKGSAVYRHGRFGFFHGAGRAFWALPGSGVWRYFRYEVGFWVLGSLWLVGGGVGSLVRPVGGEPTEDAARDDEVVACCATLHAAFVTGFYGLRTSWAYYFTILILGLAVRAKGTRARVVVGWCLAGLLLINDRSKLVDTYRDWSRASAGPETLGLWATPEERAEWRKVLELIREQGPGPKPVLLGAVDDSAPLLPRFAPPAAGYFCPGLTLDVEARRKAEQLASARTIVAFVHADWEGLTYWPELAAALDGCEIVFEGRSFRVYRRTRPPSQPVSAPAP